MINYPGGWDTHSNHFQTMRRQCPQLDQGLAMLLQDLHDRGLLESTFVWCCGEFGRGPKVDWQPPWNGGRNHYGNVFTVLVAGGGFKGGQVVGSSDAKAEEVKDRPVYPVDLLGSIYELAGIDAGATAASTGSGSSRAADRSRRREIGRFVDGDHVIESALCVRFAERHCRLSLRESPSFAERKATCILGLLGLLTMPAAALAQRDSVYRLRLSGGRPAGHHIPGAAGRPASRGVHAVLCRGRA